MTFHAEDAHRRPGISQVVDLLLAVPASEACGAKGLVSGEDSQILDFVSAIEAAVGATLTDEGAVSKQQ